MQKKSNKPVKARKPGLTTQQRARRMQTILFGALAVIMILSMIIALVAR